MEKDRYRRGAHTVLELQYHFVWKTKYSYPVLQGDIGLRTRDLIKQICAEKEMSIIRGNIRANHIHVLYQVAIKERIKPIPILLSI